MQTSTEDPIMPKHCPPVGAPCWFELSSTDPGASLAFHHALFGWDHVDNDMGEIGTYSFLRNANGSIGALCAMPPGSEGQASSWGVYFGVPDLQASLTQARELGGRLLAEPFEAPGHGRGAVLADPTGAVFSLWQPAQADAGDFSMFEDYAVGWVELATRDAAAARAFYGALLGWEFQPASVPVPGVEYTEYAVAGTRYGGIMQMTPEWGDMPSHWSIYIPVSDVDACLARAVELGGKVCVPAFDAPGVGRIARLDDPTGAGAYVIRLTHAAPC
jgi:predicted enzyme related to lactoylglutathione lyase